VVGDRGDVPRSSVDYTVILDARPPPDDDLPIVATDPGSGTHETTIAQGDEPDDIG